MKLMIMLCLSLFFALGCGSDISKKGGGDDGNNGANNGSNNGENNGENNSNNGVNNCDGCVTGDVCEDGDSELACGQGGEACFACSDGWQCVGGTCVEPTSCAASCEGCCDGEVCVQGTSEALCGKAGETCNRCDLEASCTQNECVLPCEATCAGCCVGETCELGDQNAACGSAGEACSACSNGDTCGGGTCNSPAQNWDLFLISAEISAKNAQGEDWDPVPFPDPVVTVVLKDPSTLLTYSGTSTTAQDSFTPSWNTTLIANFPAEAMRSIEMYVYDEDLLQNDLICEVALDYTGSDELFADLFGGQAWIIGCSVPNTNAYASVAFRLVAR